MTTFTITADNNITAFPTLAQAEASGAAGAMAFTNEKEFGKVTAEWPISRFVETWNSFAGVVPFDALKPVKKFENRAKATARIWSAIQALVPQDSALEDAPPEDWPATAEPETPFDAPAEPEPTTKASRAKKAPKAPAAAKKAKPAAEPKAPRADTKKAQAIKMLGRKNGATNPEMQEAFGWQPHTVRGFIAGTLKKAGIATESFKRANGDHAYRVAEK
jgi:hypothetical protein